MSRIFETTNLQGIELKNRLIRSATWENLATDSGHMTEELSKVYEELAQGGIGLIITGYAFVCKDEQPNPKMMGIYDDNFIDDCRKLTDKVHSLDGRIVMQIAYGGSFTGYPPEGRIIWSPSGIADLATGVVPTAMTGDDIKTLIRAFGEAAARVKAAGFNGVQIHGAHSYLLSQFFNPYYNRREDEYGGSIENRARIILEVYEEIRSQVGDNFPVMIKINSEDFIDGGATIEDSLQLAQMLDERGIDAIEVSGGGSGSKDKMPPRMKINRLEKEAYHAEFAKKIAEAVTAPVILVGGIRSPETIEKLLETSKIEYFSMSRPLLAEPNLPRRWQEGDRGKSHCVSCNGCLKMVPGGNYCIHRKKENA